MVFAADFAAIRFLLLAVSRSQYSGHDFGIAFFIVGHFAEADPNLVIGGHLEI